MRTVEINVYKINELSREAQERAYENWLQEGQYPWSYDNLKTLREFEDIFPVKVKSFEYGEGGSYISFVFTADGDIENLSGIRLLKYLYNNYFSYLFQRKTYYKNKKRRISKIMYVHDCSLTGGYYMDEEILEPIYNFLKNPRKDITFYGLMEKCLNAWVKACEEDFKEYFSFENFIDIAIINDWEYKENGEEC